MTEPTTPDAVRPQPGEAAHTKRRKAWPWILAAVVAVLAAAGGTAYAISGGGVGGKDPGIVACERAADRAANGQTADASDDEDVQLLKDSEHADLREVGEAIEGAADAPDLGDVMRVGVQMMAACARHGVVIDPTS